MITLTASARFGYGGKQFIAQITGRDKKFTFDRTFIGKKGGKRGESSTADIDENGLYETRDIDSKGRSDDTYYVVYTDPKDGKQTLSTTNKERAMNLAKLLEGGMDFEEARQATKPPAAPKPVKVTPPEPAADEFEAAREKMMG